MTTSAEFVQRIKPFRRELVAHCYRMLGSLDDAEDAVQETALRAWRAYDKFEGRSSLRAWLYKIATNVCLTALEHADRRVLPSGLGDPSEDPHATPVMAGSEVRWVEPFPDSLTIADNQDDPGAVAALREGLRLALIASFQYLPARQRAVLILCEVLAFAAAEVAEMLEMTTAAVKSTLQRARAQLDNVPALEDIDEPSAPEARALLDRYMAAFEGADASAIEGLLREDATLEMVPARTWFSGKRTCAPFIVGHALGAPGDWRMTRTGANGQPAVVAYLRGSDGAHHPFGVAVLSLTPQGISRIVVFQDPALVERFIDNRRQ